MINIIFNLSNISCYFKVLITLFQTQSASKESAGFSNISGRAGGNDEEFGEARN